MAQLLFTARTGGVSTDEFSSLNLGDHVGDNPADVSQNREILGKLVSQSAPVFMDQVHGDSVVEITAESRKLVTADAIITKVVGLPLVVLVADCLPILISGGSVVGAVHAGRKGILNGIISNTVLAMRNLGARELKAKIGPAICRDCYEVDLQMYENALSQSAELATSPEQHCLDLVTAAKSQLQSLGVETTSVDICTAHDTNYFSYRRDGQTGRSAGVIVL